VSESGHYRGGFGFAGLVELARELRRKGTPAEALFWELVRDRRLLGLKFRRQHQIGLYLVDFCCHELRLVVELDGEIHRGRQQHDRVRDAWLQSEGIAILRFPNRRVLDEPEAVLERIAVISAGGDEEAGRETG
jgi:very-short-patch-repair endonuclease